MRGSTNKSPIKLNAVENKVDTVICLRMGKTSKAKTLLGEFKFTTLENPLLSKQAVTSKWIPIPYTNLQLNFYPNTQLDLLCSNNHFQCTTLSMWLTNRCTDPSTWLTHQLEKNVGCKVLQFINTMKITKLLGYKTLRHTNAAASSRERWTRATLSPITVCLHQQVQQPSHPVRRPLK